MKGLDWNKIIRFSCLVSLLNEALLHVSSGRVSKPMILARMGGKPSFDDRSVHAHCAK